MLDIILTTNSPGEVSAWVRPVVKKINELNIETKIFVFTPPCVFSSGSEGDVLSDLKGVTATYNSREYLKYILLNKSPKNFNPKGRGFVLSLGGDLMHAVFLGKKLNYPIYSYTENGFGFKNSINKFYLSDHNLYNKLSKSNIEESKLLVVGNLMFDSVEPELSRVETKRFLNKKDNELLINILPGSRPKEFNFVLPLFINSIIKITQQIDNLKFILSKSPFIDSKRFKEILDDERIKGEIDYIVDENKLIINDNIEIKIIENNLHSVMRESDFALTIPGTNNLELAVLNTPMLVVVPLNDPDIIPLQGLVGLIGEIPILGKALKRKVIPKKLENMRYTSLVNKIAQREIVPELIGVIEIDDLVTKIKNLIKNDKINKIRSQLETMEINKGASDMIVNDILKDLGIQIK